MITIDQMVQREVNCCLSSLVSALTQGFYTLEHGKDGASLVGLCEQANELAAPVLDYEEAARQNGWISEKEYNGEDDGVRHPESPSEERLRHCPDAAAGDWAENWQGACAQQDLEPCEWEVYEHWAVSQWLAEKLIAQGERVDTDFASLNCWARTTTGQAISMDGCIQRIYADMMAPHTLDSVAPGA